MSCPNSWRDLFFLPQKPYMTTGSLYEQLVYPQLIAAPESANTETENKVWRGVL